MTRIVDTDVVVVVPGIMGSTLGRRSKRDPDRIAMVWEPSAGAVLRAITTLGGSIRDMKLAPGIGDSAADDRVVPVGLMPDLHVIPGIWSVNIGYGQLVDWLKSRFALRTQSDLIDGEPLDAVNLVLFAYDWRLSNRYNARRLATVVEPVLERRRSRPGCGDAKLIFVCHSMGGLVARWYVGCEGGDELTRKLVTLGTPHRGALNALESLVNGVPKGRGWLAGIVTPFARSLPSLHQLLPAYACVQQADGTLARLERAEGPSAPGAPPTVRVGELNTMMVRDAMAFHDVLADLPVASIRPIVGIRQPTRTTGRLGSTGFEPDWLIEGNDEGGDATVPRLSAAPKGMASSADVIATVAQQHGSLQGSPQVLDLIEGTLTGSDVAHLGPSETCEVGLHADDLLEPGDPLTVAVTVTRANIPLRLRVGDEAGADVARVTLTPNKADEVRHVTFDVEGPLPPGVYEVTASGATRSSAVQPVTAHTLVLPAESPI